MLSRKVVIRTHLHIERLSWKAVGLIQVFRKLSKDDLCTQRGLKTLTALLNMPETIFFTRPIGLRFQISVIVS